MKQLISHLRKLRVNKSYRTEQKLVLIEGKKVVLEIASQCKVKRLFVAEGCPVPQNLLIDKIQRVPLHFFERVSGVESPEPYIAELSLPPPSSLVGKTKILALDGLRDPGNLGTLIRTGLALGFDGVFTTDDCADIFNDKSIRAAKGASFILPYNRGNIQDLWEMLDSNCFHAYAGDLHGKPVNEISFSLPLVLILGNEATGPSQLSLGKAQLVTIPMLGQADSLNVAVAGGILMHYMSSVS